MQDEIKDVPDGDVLIHAGDLTMDGRPNDIFAALRWLSGLPHDHIIVVPGNHDFAFQHIPEFEDIARSRFPRVDLLIDAQTSLNGLRLWGSPWQPWFHDWAYNFARGPAGEAQAEDKWGEIPDDTAILITHGPVCGILDKTQRGEHVGCPALRRRIAQLSQLRLHVCGHIHEAHGKEVIDGVTYVNACVCNSQYWPSQSPIVVDL